MKYDIILCGVGGQGVLSVAAAIATAATALDLKVRQSEVHGMAQRGGAVMSFLRLSSDPIPGDLIPRGGADMILSMEPLEALRYVGYLKPSGTCITAGTAYKNIPTYPNLEDIRSKVASLPSSQLVEAEALAKGAGNPRGMNMVMVGAASNNLPLSQESLEKAVALLFARKGEGVVASNIKAFRAGREAQTAQARGV